MEYGNTDIKKVLRKYISPHALVFSSDKARGMFKNYGMTPAEFLRPFGMYNGATHYNPFPDPQNANIGKFGLLITSSTIPLFCLFTIFTT